MRSASPPCGACKFLRRKCPSDCVFAPHFAPDIAPARFAAIHKIFGASNVSKLLAHVPVDDRCEAADTIAYEAEARIHDPVYGCVSHVFALQQQIVCLQEQLRKAKSQLARAAAMKTRLPCMHLNKVEVMGEEDMRQSECDLGELDAIALRMMRKSI